MWPLRPQWPGSKKKNSLVAFLKEQRKKGFNICRPILPRLKKDLYNIQKIQNIMDPFVFRYCEEEKRVNHLL